MFTLKCWYQVFLSQASVDECHSTLQDTCATVKLGAILSGLTVKLVYKACGNAQKCGEICNETLKYAVKAIPSTFQIASCDVRNQYILF